jgi:hypothetical protein
MCAAGGGLAIMSRAAATAMWEGKYRQTFFFFLLGERNPIVVHDASNVVGGLHIMRLSIMACAGLPSFFLPFLTE